MKLNSYETYVTFTSCILILVDCFCIVRTSFLALRDSNDFLGWRKSASSTSRKF